MREMSECRTIRGMSCYVDTDCPGLGDPPESNLPGDAVEGQPAVPVGFEGKYGDAGFTLEETEIHPQVLAFTGHDVAPVAGTGLLLAVVGAMIVGWTKRLAR